MRFGNYYFIQIIASLLLAGLLLSCRSRSATTNEPASVKEERLPVAKSIELIHNAAVHSEKYLWEVQYRLNNAVNKKSNKEDFYTELIAVDSMMAVGRGRCWISLQLLEKIAEPDSVIIYKGRAKKIIEQVYGVYSTEYSELVNMLRWSNDPVSTDMFTKTLSPVVGITLSMIGLENTATWLREKYNIPKKEFDFTFPENDF